MEKNHRPLNDNEKADAYMTIMLDRIKDWAEDKDMSSPGAPLKVALLVMHTQALAFQQRPELVPRFIEAIEGLMIETKMTDRDAVGVRKLGEQLMRAVWKRIDNMVADADDKLDA